MESEPARSSIIDRSKLPRLYPTHQHDPPFWCSLALRSAAEKVAWFLLEQAGAAATIHEMRARSSAG